MPALLFVPLAAFADPSIGRVNTGGYNTLSMCSGTLVRPQTVVTAAHCVAEKDGTPRRAETIIFVAGWNGAGHAGAATVARIEMHPDAYRDGRLNPLDDVAVLRLADPIRLETMPVAVAPQGDFAIAGYKRSRAHRLHLDTPCPGRTERGLLFLDCPAEQGMSGGPVLAGTGERRRLVGVLVARRQDGAVAVPVGDWLRVTLSRPYPPAPD